MSAPTVQNTVQNLGSDRLLAAIDVGTNSIHMVVVKIQPQIPAFTIVTKEKSTVRLGDRDPLTGLLTLEAMARAIAALKRCQEIAVQMNAEAVVAVATSAVREAPNGRTFLAQIETELGLTISLISGQEEARRIYLGVLSGMELQNQAHVMIDIGGGSTELILGDGQEPRSLSSTKVGAVRLSAELVKTDPISNSEFAYLQSYVKSMMGRAIEEIRENLRPGEKPRMIGTSGTIETLAVIHAREKLGIVPAPLNGYQFSLKDLREIVNRLRKLNYAERSAVPGMSERRSEIIVAGAVILQETMTLLGIENITICERSLREGVVVDWMLTHGLIEDRLRFQSSIRQRSVLKIAQKYGVNLEHSERVAAFAVDLFDQTKGIFHEWGMEVRELLWASAILHNCGHFISHSAHHKHSYYLIRNSDLLGYTEAEVETIANLARYHRKSDPKKKHDTYRCISSKLYRRMVDQLYPLLRLAVAMDRRQRGAIAKVHVDFQPALQQVHFHLKPTDLKDDCTTELWSLNYQKGSFERAFGVKLMMKLVD